MEIEVNKSNYFAEHHFCKPHECIGFKHAAVEGDFAEILRKEQEKHESVVRSRESNDGYDGTRP